MIAAALTPEGEKIQFTVTFLLESFLTFDILSHLIPSTSSVVQRSQSVALLTTWSLQRGRAREVARRRERE